MIEMKNFLGGLTNDVVDDVVKCKGVSHKFTRLKTCRNGGKQYRTNKLPPVGLPTLHPRVPN